MTRFKRLRAAYATIRMIGVVIRSWYVAQRYKDEIRQIGQEMAECEDCEAVEPCEKHGEEIDDLYRDGVLIP